MELAGKVAVVTGASMGIGEAIAKLFVDRGARVILLSRDSNRAEAARHRVGRTEQTLALSCDVRNREEIDRVLSLTLHHFDRIEMAACRAMFDTNLFGAIACMQAVLPVMKQQGTGAIINISSVGGHVP